MCCPLYTTVTTSTTIPLIIESHDLPIPTTTNMSSIKSHRKIGLINDFKCGTDMENKMYDGNNAKLLQYKWSALLQFNSTVNDKKLKIMCGGSLIAGN